MLTMTESRWKVYEKKLYYSFNAFKKIVIVKNLKNVSKIKVSSLWSLICSSRQWSSHLSVYAYVLSLFSCVRLCDPMVHSPPPGSSVYGIPQARILEWVVMPSSRGSSWPRDWTHVSYVSCIGRWVLYHKCHQGSLYIYTHIYVGGGNGDPLQYSFPENPMDGGTWRAAVHGGRKELDMTEWLTQTHTHALMAELHCCIAETNTMLWSNFPPTTRKEYTIR